MKNEPIVENPTLLERILKRQMFVADSQGLLTNSESYKELIEFKLKYYPLYAQLNENIYKFQEAFNQVGSKAEDITKGMEKLVEVWQNAAKRPSGKL